MILDMGREWEFILRVLDVPLLLKSYCGLFVVWMKWISSLESIRSDCDCCTPDSTRYLCEVPLAKSIPVPEKPVRWITRKHVPPNQIIDPLRIKRLFGHSCAQLNGIVGVICC